MKIVNKLNPEDVYSPEGVKLFSFNELACRSSQIYAFHGNFLDELIKLRIVLNKPMSITSACRSLEHNTKIGGHPRSLHIYDKPIRENQKGGLAVDVKSQGAGYNLQLIKCALDLGWSVGVAKTFIHLDRRDMVGLQPGIFGYG